MLQNKAVQYSEVQFSAVYFRAVLNNIVQMGCGIGDAIHTGQVMKCFIYAGFLI